MEDLPVKPELPWAFIDCNSDDLVVLISHMLNRLIEHNDQVELTSSSLTRFHSRAPPQISVIDYLRRIVKYTNVEKLPLLSLLAYIDITCVSLPTFTLSSLTVHRFLISGVTAGSKALCDVFCTNSHYAKVGGIKVGELNGLEREFLRVTEWNLCVHAELLQQYYSSLIKSHGGYTQASKPDASVFTTFPLEERETPRVVTDDGEVLSDDEEEQGMADESMENEEGGEGHGAAAIGISQAHESADLAMGTGTSSHDDVPLVTGDQDVEMADPTDEAEQPSPRGQKGKGRAIHFLSGENDVNMDTNPATPQTSTPRRRRSSATHPSHDVPFPSSSTAHGPDQQYGGEPRPALASRHTSGSSGSGAPRPSYGLSPGGTAASPRLSVAAASGSGSGSTNSSAKTSPIAHELRSVKESLTSLSNRSDAAEERETRRSPGPKRSSAEGGLTASPSSGNHEAGLKQFVGGLFKSRSFASWSESRGKNKDVTEMDDKHVVAETASPITLTPRIRTRSERSTDGIERGRGGKQKRQDGGSPAGRTRGLSEDSGVRNESDGGTEGLMTNRGRKRQDGKPVVRGIGVG